MKILFVVKNLRLSNGVSSYIMNYYRKIIKDSKIKIDFLVVKDVGSPYYDEIKENGGNIFLLPSYKKHMFRIPNYLKKIFHENNYDIIHCNVINSGAIILFYAKICKIPVRILHTHATQNGDSIFKNIINSLFKGISIFFANKLVACSEFAGKSTFGKRDFFIINNAIDIEKYRYNEKSRKEIRKKYSVDDKYIIMTVGRITKQKNPFFIVDIAKKLQDDNIEFWWFGNGDLDSKIMEYIKNNNVNNIVLWGACENVYSYYSAADMFILPSLYEGLPVVGIEAQMSGIKCLFSNRITKEVSISPYSEFLDINSVDTWVEMIKKSSNYNRQLIIKKLDKDKFDISKEYDCLVKLYRDFRKETK